MNNVPVYKLRLARTLYNNFYRARLQDANGEDAGQLLIVPGLPLDRSQLPENAPIADPYLLVIVEDADINKNNVIDFEEGVSRAVLAKFTTETTSFIPHRLSILHRTKNSLSSFYYFKRQNSHDESSAFLFYLSINIFLSVIHYTEVSCLLFSLNLSATSRI